MNKKILLLALVAHMGAVPHVHAQGLSAEQKAQLKKWGAVVGVGVAVIVSAGLVYIYKRPAGDIITELEKQRAQLEKQRLKVEKKYNSALSERLQEAPRDQALQDKRDLSQEYLNFSRASERLHMLAPAKTIVITRRLIIKLNDELDELSAQNKENHE